MNASAEWCVGIQPVRAVICVTRYGKLLGRTGNLSTNLIGESKHVAETAAHFEVYPRSSTPKGESQELIHIVSTFCSEGLWVKIRRGTRVRLHRNSTLIISYGQFDRRNLSLLIFSNYPIGFTPNRPPHAKATKTIISRGKGASFTKASRVSMPEKSHSLSA